MNTHDPRFTALAGRKVLITGGIGHNLPQEAPQAFAKAVIDADGAHIVSNEIFAASDDVDARPQFPLTSELSRRLSVHGYGDTMVGVR